MRPSYSPYALQNVRAAKPSRWKLERPAAVAKANISAWHDAYSDSPQLIGVDLSESERFLAKEGNSYDIRLARTKVLEELRCEFNNQSLPSNVISLVSALLKYSQVRWGGFTRDSLGDEEEERRQPPPEDRPLLFWQCWTVQLQLTAVQEGIWCNFELKVLPMKFFTCRFWEFALENLTMQMQSWLLCCSRVCYSVIRTFVRESEDILYSKNGMVIGLQPHLRTLRIFLLYLCRSHFLKHCVQVLK